jgi:hypothetical protein
MEHRDSIYSDGFLKAWVSILELILSYCKRRTFKGGKTLVNNNYDPLKPVC